MFRNIDVRIIPEIIFIEKKKRMLLTNVSLIFQGSEGIKNIENFQNKTRIVLLNKDREKKFARKNPAQSKFLVTIYSRLLGFFFCLCAERKKTLLLCTLKNTSFLLTLYCRTIFIADIGEKNSNPVRYD